MKREISPMDELIDPEFRKQVQGLKDVTAALNGEPSSPVIFSTDAESVLNRKLILSKEVQQDVDNAKQRLNLLSLSDVELVDQLKHFQKHNPSTGFHMDPAAVFVIAVEIDRRRKLGKTTEVNSGTCIRVTDVAGNTSETTVGDFVRENGLPLLDWDDQKCVFQNDSDYVLFKMQLHEEGKAVMPGFQVYLTV